MGTKALTTPNNRRDVFQPVGFDKEHPCPGQGKNQTPTDIGRFEIVGAQVFDKDVPKGDPAFHGRPPAFSFSFFMVSASIPVICTKISSRVSLILRASLTSAPLIFQIPDYRPDANGLVCFHPNQAMFRDGEMEDGKKFGEPALYVIQ